MPIHCRVCGSSNLRVSHFRVSDLAKLMVLRYPVRRRVCRQRGHIPIMQSIRLRRNDTEQPPGRSRPAECQLRRGLRGCPLAAGNNMGSGD
jgi:hypothetical protein